jgi:hypothetical protein
VKKLIFISGLVIVFVACGSNEQKTEEPTVVSADTAKTDHAVTATPEVKDLLNIIMVSFHAQIAKVFLRRSR